MSKSLPPLPSNTAAATDNPPGWILLVDDESLIRQLVEIVLSTQGYAVRSADSAQSALALINAAAVPPALLICDVVMPQTDGLTLTRQLLARLPGLKVIFISGHLADSAWWPADMSGIRLLAKPLDNAELIVAVNEAFAGPGAVN